MLQEALSRMPEVFEAKVLLRGQEYFSKGQVLNIRLSEGLMKARVKGSSNRIYDVHMDLKKWPNTPSRCSCPYQLNCKHAAASLFALHDKERHQLPHQTPSRLDLEIENWLKKIRIKEQIGQRQEASHRLVYLLDLNLNRLEHQVVVRLALAKILKKGGLGKPNILFSLDESKKQHFLPEDNEIVAQLLLRANDPGFMVIHLRNSELLSMILKTGRAYFQDLDKPLQAGETRSMRLQWQLHSDGYQRLQPDPEAARWETVLLDCPWYFDFGKQVMGLLDLPYSVGELRNLISAPPVPLDQLDKVVKQLKEQNEHFPLPALFKSEEVRQVTPRTRLYLDAYSYTIDDEDIKSWVYSAELRFDYDGSEITYFNEAEAVIRAEGEKIYRYPRDDKFEEKQADKLFDLLDLGTSSDYWVWREIPELENCYILLEATDEDDFSSLYDKAIPKLKAKGWEIVFNSPEYQQIIPDDQIEWVSELQEEGEDFFSYQLGIQVEGETVSIVPLVANLLSRYQPDVLDAMPDKHLMTLPLGHNRGVQIPLGRIKPLIRLILQYGVKNLQANQNALALSRYQLMILHETELAMAATAARWQGAEQYRHALMQLIQQNHFPEVAPPRGFNAQLRDYQQQGFEWLQFLRSNGFGGILADDMGLGKTIQTLAHLLHEKEQNRLNKVSLIVAPTSLMGNWQAEAARFSPDLKVLVFHGQERHQDNWADYDLVISTYGIIQRDKQRFIDEDFYYLILDEAQFIKNAKAKTTQVIQQLKARHRLCLTGTPMENHLGELWSLFNFLMPGLLGDSKQFAKWFKTPIEKQLDLNRKKLLINRVKPFMLRRTKNQVAHELPPKTEMLRLIALEGKQRDLYEGIRMTMEKKVREAISKQGLDKSHIVLLDALLKLRQICCDPRLLSLEEVRKEGAHSAKLEALMELLENLLEEGRRVLVFSQFTSMLALIEERLKNKHYPYLKLTGQTTNRQAMVDEFQSGTVPIFLISLKAGGTGLNLTKADTVIHYDPWWNPAVEEQATDRSHRIGQENPVFVYKLITEGTVEQAILAMQEKKRSLFESVLSDNASGKLGLTEQDIAAFFAPIAS